VSSIRGRLVVVFIAALVPHYGTNSQVKLSGITVQ
jgi:hypothetical protein